LQNQINPNQLLPTDIGSIHSGKLIVNEFGNGFLNTNNLINNLTIYIAKSDLNFAYSDVEADVEIISNNNSQYSGRVINFNIIGRKFVGQVHHMYKSDVFVYVDQLSKSNLIAIQTPIQLSPNDFLYVEITSISNGILIGKFLQKLSSDIDQIINFIYGLDERYTDLLISDLNTQNNLNTQTNPDIETIINAKRIDLTDHDVFTIDPPSCLDCDDAFSICVDKSDSNKYHIYVHIADITEYINPSKPYFDALIKRANTIYGKNMNWPMIPRDLAENICSILPNKPTNVITSEFIYDQSTGSIHFVDYFYSKIISKSKYDYDYVDQHINSNSKFEFKILNATSKIISKQFSEIVPNLDTEAHQMVKNWMLYLNQIMGKMINSLFRIHAAPNKSQTFVLEQIMKKHNISNCDKFDMKNRSQTIDQLSELKLVSDNKTNKLVDHLIKSIQTKATYSDQNTLHYGIGIDSYTHFTSPIRRASDVLVHLLLKGYQIDIKPYIKYLNEGDYLQNRIETFIRKHNYQINIGQQFDSVIIGISRTGIIIYVYDLDDTFNIHISKLDSDRLVYQNQTLINSNITYNLFDEFKVRTTKYDFFKPEFEKV
jgi:ribonuclease R